MWRPLWFIIAISSVVIAQRDEIDETEDWNEDECGKSPKSFILTRIIGGETSVPGDWPWMAALVRNNNLRCGGSLVSNQHIVTAAQCVYLLKPESIKVRLGQYSLRNPNPETIEYSVEEIKIHPEFAYDRKINDIAVLKLGRKVKISEFIHPICLASTDLQPEDLSGIVTGWGFTEYQGQVSDNLREISAPIWKNNVCQAALEKTILDSQFCAGSIDGKKDSCTGDSGGPLAIFDSDAEKWQLAGIVSYGRECGRPSTPAIYTRVSTYLEWIQQYVSSASSNSTETRQPNQDASKSRGCGFDVNAANNNRRKRLVGGRQAEKGKWIWMAALFDKFDSHVCGGALITNQHVLTAAHCVLNLNASEITVRLGEFNNNRRSEQNFGVESIHIHEKYQRTASTSLNDIALLKLNNKVVFSNLVQHICMPRSNISLDGRTAFLAGWSKESSRTEVFSEAQLSIWNHEECKLIYKQWNMEINDEHLCAGNRDSSRDACSRDGGNPLMHRQRATGRWTVVGIVSFGKGCGTEGVPGVYTRVNKYWEWIRSQVHSELSATSR